MGSYSRQRFSRVHCRVLPASVLFATTAHAQVISAQSLAPVAPADYLASTRLQFGLTQPQTYQGAILGGQRILSDQQAVITAQGGFTAGTNPPFWNQTTGNSFTLSYTASSNTLTLRVLRPSGAQQFSISDTVNLAGAGGLNFDFGALNNSTFGGIRLTSAGQTVNLGPSGQPWSSTSLANSTLTGWDLGSDWSITGSVLFQQPGQDALPRLQTDILAPGLAYQLSHDPIAPTTQVYNYGITQAMVVRDADFLQAAYGGTDGIIEADISSAAPVTFDVAGNQQYSGSITDLTSSLVAAQYRGDASLVKDGNGTLTLTGASSYSGFTAIAAGTLAISDSNQLGSGGIIFGNNGGTAPVLAVDFSGGTDTLTQDITAFASDVTLDVAAGTLNLTGTIGGIDGTEGLVKRGVGTLNLSGLNDLAGPTTIVDGTVGITDVTQLGTGGLVFGDGSGTGTPILSANLPDEQSLVIDLPGGGLFMDASSATFDIQGGTLGIAGSVSETGSNDIVKLGAGTLVLDLAGTYGGKLDVQEGTVAVASAGAVGGAGIQLGDAAVRMDVDFTSAAGQDLAVVGTGTMFSTTGANIEWNSGMTSAAGDSLELTGLAFRLNGDASALLGGLDVNDTQFTMDGSTIGSSVLARNGSSFDANGTVSGDMTVQDATLSASGGDNTRPGTLNVGGSLSLSAASLLRSNLFLTESAPNQRESDRVVVSGSATMGGSVLAVHDSAVAPGTLVPDLGVTKTWQLISAPGSASGTPSSVSLMLTEGGTTATISLAVNGTIIGAGVEVTTLFNANGGFISMTGVGELPPDVVLQTACGPVTGAEINSLVDQLLLVQQDGTMDAKEVATALLFERPEDLPASFSATQQQNPYATPSVVMDSNFMAGQTAMLRLMQMRDGAMGAAAAKASDASGGQAPTVEASNKDYGAPINGPTPDEGTRAWMRGYGFYEDVEGNPCSDCGYTAAIGSALVGMDWAIDGGGIVGVYGGIGPGQITTDAVNGWQREDLATVTAGIYGSWVPTDSQAYVAGFLNGGYQDINRVRNINIETVGIDRTATSSNDSWSLAVGGELGLNLAAGEATTLQPYVGVGWAQYWGGSYSENGADSLDLQVDSQSANEWQPTVGARLLQEFKIGNDILTPYIGAAFLAQLPVGSGWNTTYTSEFNLDAATQLTTTPQDRYGASFQAGVEFATIKGMTCYIAFDGAVLTDKQRYGGQVGVLVPF